MSPSGGTTIRKHTGSLQPNPVSSHRAAGEKLCLPSAVDAKERAGRSKGGDRSEAGELRGP